MENHRTQLKNISLLALLLILGTLTACFRTPEDPITPGGTKPNARVYNWAAIADSAQFGLTSNYWNAAGKYFTVQIGGSAFNGNYWPNAHALDVLVDAYLRKDKDPAIKQRMDELIEGVRVANGNTYINYYYDDMQWMTISTLRAFNATGDARYKTMADGLWTDVKGGWDNVSGGGFYWRKDRENKNTPANAPACIFAARLYQVNRNPDDLAWATRTYNWLKTNMIQTNGDVLDGLYTNVTPFRIDTRLFTYNYGTVIGSALELYKITGDISYQTDAIRVADAALARMTRENVLVNGDFEQTRSLRELPENQRRNAVVERHDAARHPLRCRLESAARLQHQPDSATERRDADGGNGGVEEIGVVETSPTPLRRRGLFGCCSSEWHSETIRRMVSAAKSCVA
ncbi:MAG: hypothetical protein MUD08_13875 [Cytophagales bacterium]|nr:hypothetical protein [Cytophagales bacterium]